MCTALRSGLDQLGVHAAEVPRNCLNPDCSGHCGHGCARGYKQVSAASRAAGVVVCCYVQACYV